jgi:hypothetical protein
MLKLDYDGYMNLIKKYHSLLTIFRLKISAFYESDLETSMLERQMLS